MFLGPYFPSPFSDFFAVLAPNYRIGLRNDLCAKLGMRFVNCLEAYGNVKAQEKCLDLYYDMYECQNARIQQCRVREIREERKRQYRAGKIKSLYSEEPPLESYFNLKK